MNLESVQANHIGLGRRTAIEHSIAVKCILSNTESIHTTLPRILFKTCFELVFTECFKYLILKTKCKNKCEQFRQKAGGFEYLTCMPPCWLTIVHSKSSISLYFKKSVKKRIFRNKHLQEIKINIFCLFFFMSIDDLEISSYLGHFILEPRFHAGG